MQLKDFEMMPTESPKGVQAIIQFGDEYQLSIIQSDFSYGGSKGLYEIGVFKNGEMTQLPGITLPNDTVRGFLTEADVNSVILKMHTLTRADPRQV